MKPDIYTKAVLTVIAIMLAVIASNQYINPPATAHAQAGPFAGVQFFGGDGGGVTAVDTRTGEVWSYFSDGPIRSHMRITRLGQPAAPLK